jgi:RNA polymerase sigma factor (sigma-70 family)
MPASTAARTHRVLGAPETRRFLCDYVRKRVGESDVDDVVQTVLVEALASDRVPEDETEIRKWLVGVARHKIADLHRRRGREQPAELPDIETAPAPVEEREMAKWAEEQAKSSREAQKTLEWMAREGEGDKLEHIAEEEQLPAARVRQRVSRMRRFMKERWIAELAAVAVLAVLGVLIWRALRDRPIEIAREVPSSPTNDPKIEPPPIAPKVAEAGELRKKALEDCARGAHKLCLDGLDKAKDLDPAGDTQPEIQKAREAAQKALEEEQKIQQKQEDAPAPEPSVTAPPPTPKNIDSKPTPTDFFPEKKGKTPPPKKAPSKAELDGEGSKESSFNVQSPEATKEVLAPPPPKPTAQAPQPQQFPQMQAPRPSFDFGKPSGGTGSTSIGKK